MKIFRFLYPITNIFSYFMHKKKKSKLITKYTTNKMLSKQIQTKYN